MLVLVVLLTGCGTSRTVRLETGRGPSLVVSSRTGEARPVHLRESDFEKALAMLAALASADPQRVETVATALPELMGGLTREFQSIQEGARVAMERTGQAIAVAQLLEMLTLGSAMKLALPRLAPAAPTTLGAGLVVGSNGVMLGSQVVVSAEWVERMRRLVQAGVLSVSAVSATVRIHAGMMAQASGDLPKGVRDALGEGPEVRGMHETGRAGAGMGEPPKHHVLPREHREWFEKRGFTGDMDMARRMEPDDHGGAARSRDPGWRDVDAE